MVLKWSRFLLLAALLLSGCFRPAGDSIPPTSEITNMPAENSGATATSAAPAITLLSPGDATSESTATSAAPALTAITLAPATATPAPTEPSGTATLQIITPGISLGLLTPDTATPLPFSSSTDEVGVSSLASGTQEASGADCTYTVEDGDSLYAIALSFDTTVDDMTAANPQLEGDPPVLQIGDVLNLPNCAPGVGLLTPTPEASDVEAEATEATDELPPGSEIYTVQPGDTMVAIATRYGVTVGAITRANNLSNPDVLSIGQKLIIPPKPTAAPTSTSTRTSN